MQWELSYVLSTTKQKKGFQKIPISMHFIVRKMVKKYGFINSARTSGV